MCGIVGYTGDGPALPILLKGLGTLEYRGYDSSGTAVFTENGIKTVKASGKLSALYEKLGDGSALSGTTGIAHTRWATHGAPSERNAHPHSGEKNLFTVVHNGIIENYAEIKEELLKKGRRFFTDTDTEIIAQLLEEKYNGNPLETLEKTVKHFKGSYALAILCSDCPEKIFCACLSSPLLVGIGENGCYTASDAAAIIPYTSTVFRLLNGEFAVLQKNGAQFFDANGNEIKKEKIKVNVKTDNTDKGQFEYFMEKEIFEQPEALARTIFPHVSDEKIAINFPKKFIEKTEKIFIVGCGSAYHAAVVGKYIFEKLLRISVFAELASEFRYMNPLVNENALVIVISQSGETADSLAALREAKARGAMTFSIVNVEGSSIAEESEAVFFTAAGREVAVATTKAYSTQLAALYMTAIHLASELNSCDTKYLAELTYELLQLPDKVSEILQSTDEICRIANKYSDRKYAYYIGRNLDYASSMEASLKLKEISYVHSEAYAAGELKHGTISLIENGTLTVALCCCDIIFSKTQSNIEEVLARGGDVVCVTSQKHANEVKCSEIITVPQSADVFMPSLEIVPMQLFSFFSAKLRKCDIDKPRNLAKSVTVE